MRLFLAISLPPDVRRAIIAATAPAREAAPDLAWVDGEKLHLTLKFFGEQPDDRVEAIRAATARVAGGLRQFAMYIGGLGAFPNFRRSRVVWIGVDQESRLELLHHDVEVACERIGFDLEGRPFRPHITLARVKHPLPEERARALSRVARRVDYRAEVIVASLDLMRSERGPRGSTHSTVQSALFRSE